VFRGIATRCIHAGNEPD
jgi:cystathionine gamma-lyase